MSRAAIRPELLRWAQERSGVSRDALLKRFPRYSQWESGEAHPTLKQLETLARKTTTPFGYFFLAKPPEDRLPVPDFRTVADTGIRRPSPNLLETIHAMQRRQSWMRDFLVEEGADPFPFVGSAKVEDDFRVIAKDIRTTLGIDSDWARHQKTWSTALRSLRLAIENSGILIILNGIVGNNTSRKLDVNEFRGFVLCDAYAPLIFVNSADAKGAQMFTVAHELAHVWLGKEGVFDLQGLQPADDAVEQHCNQIAAEFLVPEDELRAFWNNAEEYDDAFQAVARRFKVSAIVGARRALDLGMIERPTFLAFYRDSIAHDRRRKSSGDGGDFYANQGVRLGERFASAVVRAVKEGRLAYTEAYRLTGIRGRTFDRYAESLGFEMGG